MTGKEDLLARFSGRTTGGPLYVPDLSLWYDWHQTHGTLPNAWQRCSLTQIAHLLGGPVWLPTQLWTVETPGVKVRTIETADERTIAYETSGDTLVARWTLGPDSDWWQTEYPVKSKEQLGAAVELIESWRYVLNVTSLPDLQETAGPDGVVALELPKRPYSAVLHDVLGWSDGLLLLGEPEVEKMLMLLESKLQGLIEELVSLPAQFVLSPDNLDGQFISPGAFERYMLDSYRRTADLLHDHGKRLVVHVGGPVKRLLEPLAVAGVDGIQGICGPPQSDASLSEARKLVGPRITLWGGIPQDVLLETHEWEQFERAVVQATSDAAGDPRMILGVADRVPVDADVDRLKAVAELIDAVSSSPR